MNVRSLLSLALAGAQGSRSTVTSTVNGRVIVAHAPGGHTSVRNVNGVAVISLPGHAVRVEKGQVIVDAHTVRIPAKTKRVEIEVQGAQVFVTADHRVVFGPGK